MAAGSTYTPIATYTIPSPQASYTFNSFSGYTDLILVMQGNILTSNDSTLYFRFNGDTAGNYSYTRMTGDGSTAASYREVNGTGGSAGFIGASGKPVNILQIMNYANTTTYKSTIARLNNSGYNMGASVSLWRNTAAITSITLYNASYNLDTGSTFTLYGIAKA